MLEITDVENRRTFARHLGLTEGEINGKVERALDPFLQILTLYQARGGCPDAFVQALYEVSRSIRLGDNHLKTGNVTESCALHRSVSQQNSVVEHGTKITGEDDEVFEAATLPGISIKVINIYIN